MKKFLSFLLVAMLALVLVACTTTKDDGTEKDKEKDKEKDDGKTEEVAGEDEKATEKILYLNNGEEPTSFDPSVGFNAVSWSSLNNLMEGLTRLSEDHLAIEATAEKIDISEDGLTYTFTIRDGAKWSKW